MTRHHHVRWVLVSVTVLMTGAILLYRALPAAAIAAGVGSGAIVILIVAHVGALAAVGAWFVALRRRSRSGTPENRRASTRRQ